MLSRVLAIILLFSIGSVMSACGKTSLAPVNADEVKFTHDTDIRTIDVTEVINTEEFIALRDYIVNKGEMQWLSQRFGQIPIIEYPVDKNNSVYFTVYEANRLRLHFDLIHIQYFLDTIDCDQYYLYYYPNGFDSTDASFNNGLDPYISDYNDGHVYLVGSYDTGITDEQFKRQLAYYYSLLIGKS